MSSSSTDNASPLDAGTFLHERPAATTVVTLPPPSGGGELMRVASLAKLYGTVPSEGSDILADPITETTPLSPLTTHDADNGSGLESSMLPKTVSESLSELRGGVAAPEDGAPWWKHLLSHIGPAWLVAVGYMDPGNWVGDVAGGSAFGYSLLWVVLLSSVIAFYLQATSARLGVVTGRDLAQLSRARYPRWVATILWISAECAIMATDVAEVSGSAIALYLLSGFRIPLVAGVIITAADVLLVLAIKGRSARYLEAGVSLLVGFIGSCIIALLAITRPVASEVMAGFAPSGLVFSNTEAALIAVSIVGATVMPHNLYLHSALVGTRASVAGGAMAHSADETASALRYSAVDAAVALFIAFVVNAGLLILAASAFHATGNSDVAELDMAYALLEPLLGVSAAPIIFGAALFASGQIATLTGTLAGQVVMEGFMHWRIPQWARRLISRLLAVVPAIVAVSIGGGSALNTLLLVSQVVLAFQLPLAIFPLVQFTSSTDVMGEKHRLSRLWTAVGWLVFSVIAVLASDAALVVTSFISPA